MIDILVSPLLGATGRGLTAYAGRIDLALRVENLTQNPHKIWTLTNRSLRQAPHLIVRNEPRGDQVADTAGIIVLALNTSPLGDANAYRMGE